RFDLLLTGCASESAPRGIDPARQRTNSCRWEQVDAVDEDRGRACELRVRCIDLRVNRDDLDGHGREFESIQRCACVGFGADRVRAVDDVVQFDLHENRSFRARAARRPLRITTTSAISCTSTTEASPRTPNKASGGSAVMLGSDRVMFWLMIWRPWRAWSSARGSRRRSWPVKATSADSIAASEPVAPIASPMSAAGRAGASLMPSPIIATDPCWPSSAIAAAL